MAFDGDLPVAILLSQRLIGRKQWTSDEMLDRRDFVRESALADRGDLLVVTGLGSATYDAAAAGDHPLNFYLWGAMGGTAMIGLGLALARPDRRVAVITGDGDMLMGLGSLATIGVKQPKNLAIVVLDNAPLRRDRHAGERTRKPASTSSPWRSACRFRRRRQVSRIEEAAAGARASPSAARARSSSMRGSRPRTRRAFCRCATATRSSSASSPPWVISGCDRR